MRIEEIKLGIYLEINIGSEMSTFLFIIKTSKCKFKTIRYSNALFILCSVKLFITYGILIYSIQLGKGYFIRFLYNFQ